VDGVGKLVILYGDLNKLRDYVKKNFPWRSREIGKVTRFLLL
jgi:hypothetical protein